MSDIRINKIQINTQKAAPKKEKQEAAEEQTITSSPEVKTKSADEVLDFMANQAMLGNPGVKSKKPVDPSKYVDEASQKRIEQVMKTFEETIFNGTQEAIALGLSEKTAGDVAITAFGRKYLG